MPNSWLIALVTTIAFCSAGQTLFALQIDGEANDIDNRDNSTPFQIDDVLPKNSRINVTIRSRFSTSQAEGQLIILQPVSIAPGIFIRVPSQIDSESSVDSFRLGIDAGYGISSRISLFAGVGGLSSNSTSVILGEQQSSHATEFSNLYAGASYAITPSNSSFYTTVSINMPIIQKIGDEYVYGKAVTANMNTFYAYDPLVLSLSSSLSYFLERELNGNAIKPGTVASISPQVSFTVNPNMSMDWSVSFAYLQPSAANGIQEVNSRRVQADFNMGLTVSVARNTRWGINTGWGLTGDDRASIGFSLLYQP